MIHAIADTHSVIWYLLASPRLSTLARTQFEFASQHSIMIGVSAITVVEMIYLTEKGRILPEALLRLNEKLDQAQKLLELIPVTYAIAQDVQKVPYAQIPDMPDRIIAATALHHRVPVISHDRKIKLSTVTAIW